MPPFRGGGTNGKTILTYVLAGCGIGGDDELLCGRIGDGVDQSRFVGGVHVDKETFFDAVSCDEEGVIGVGVDGAGFAGFEGGDVVAVLAVVPVDVDAVGGLVEDGEGEFVGG